MNIIFKKIKNVSTIVVYYRIIAIIAFLYFVGFYYKNRNWNNIFARVILDRDKINVIFNDNC